MRQPEEKLLPQEMLRLDGLLNGWQVNFGPFTCHFVPIPPFLCWKVCIHITVKNMLTTQMWRTACPISERSCRLGWFHFIE